MRAHDIKQISARFRSLEGRANESLGTLNAQSLGIGRYVPGSSPWERHKNGEELLYVVDGEVEIEVLEVSGPFKALLREGALFVVPRGKWHQLTAHAPVNIRIPSRSTFASDRRRQ